MVKNILNLDEREDDKDWRWELVEILDQELGGVELEVFHSAEPYDYSGDREGYRNGSRERDLFTRVGRLTMRVPRNYEGKFCIRFFDRYQRSEIGLVLALQESYLQGVSTRKRKKITETCAGWSFPESRSPAWLRNWMELWRPGEQDHWKKTYP